MEKLLLRQKMGTLTEEELRRLLELQERYNPQPSDHEEDDLFEVQEELNA